MTSILLVAEELMYFKGINQKEYDEVAPLWLIPQHLLDMNSKLLNERIVCVDIETTSTDPRYGKLLLSTWYFPLSNCLYTIYHGFLGIRYAFSRLREGFKNCFMIAHHAGFEYTWLTHYGLPRPREVWCTMVADQKVTQGMVGFRYNIIDTLNRRGVSHNIQKDVRTDFSAMTKYTDIELKHLTYNRDDTLPLYDLYIRQEFLVVCSNQEFWIKRIHMPLTMVLADIEREGLVLDTVKWLELAEKAEQELAVLDRELHNWVFLNSPRSLTDLVPGLNDIVIKYHNTKSILKDRIKKNRAKLLKWQQAGRTTSKVYQTTLDVMKRSIKQYKTLVPPAPQVNWNSSAQVLALMSNLGLSPLPRSKSATTHKMQDSLSRAARENWLLNNPSHPMRELVKKLGKFSEHSKYVNSFGREFITKYYQPLTGKVHTSYKQGTVATGRLASGNAKGNPPTFNSQQLPAKKQVRICFGTDPGYLIVTCDLSGAELITMCSLAQDHRLLELSKQDMHSYFANKGWKAIYKARGKFWTEDKIISQTQNEEKRTDYKPMTFGTIYGLKPAKAGEILNVGHAAGKLAIKTIIDEIPDTIAMVEAASAEALDKGWVLHNTRTHSRRWFRPVVELNTENAKLPEHAHRELEKGYRDLIAQQARNTKIQGTQGDLLCEAMVLLDRYIRFNKIDAQILLQVHDELAVKFHESLKDWFPARVKEIMCRAANKYLENVTMAADYSVGLTWQK